MEEVHTVVTVQSKGYIISETPPSSFKKVELVLFRLDAVQA